MRKHTMPSISILGLLLFVFSLCALAAEPAGSVLFAKGDVVALDAQNKARTLTRGASFHAGETVRTGAGAMVQLRFVDGATMALREQTEFRIDSYRYDERDAGIAASLMTLLKGGLRTITGNIAKQKPQAYKVRTPMAVVGVRGTNYELLLRSGLYVAVWQGTVVVENDRSSTVLGEGAAHKFAFVRDVNTAPQELTQPPEGLSGVLSNEPLNQNLNLNNTLPGTGSGTPSLPSAPTVPSTPTLPSAPVVPPVNVPPPPTLPNNIGPVQLPTK